MPPPMNINKDSDDDAIQHAVSMCIRFYRKEGREADQSAAICYDEAREKTGKALGKK